MSAFDSKRLLRQGRQVWLLAVVVAAAIVQLASGKCDQKIDLNGLWVGDTLVGGNYTLTCNPGFSIVKGQGHITVDTQSISISCPPSGGWAENPQCINWDSCESLTHDCGKFGVCVDDVKGYHCQCEKGVQKRLAADGSGEMVCGDSTDACGSLDCGPHGVCVELEPGDADGLLNRCSCEHGYFDNGDECAPNDCGEITDDNGVWQGVPRVGGEYTLVCDLNSFIANTVLRQVTVTCPHEGRWELEVPRCINAWRDSIDAEYKSFRWYFALCCAMLCVLGAAVAAGLTMGLVSLSDFELKLLMFMRPEECCSKEEVNQLKVDKKAAIKVRPLLKDHHRLLVTLLLLNSVANEALPIFLDQIMPAWLAVIISVTCVLFIGEILPSAVFTGPSQLWIASLFAPIVQCLQVLFCPLAVPIKHMLDAVVGHAAEGPKYNRAQLKSLLRLHLEGAPEDPNYDYWSGDDSDNTSGSDTGSTGPKERNTTATERLLAVEEGPQRTLSLQDGALCRIGSSHIFDPSEKGLRPLECMLAQQSLELSRIDIRSLHLDAELQPVPHPDGDLPPGEGAPLEIAETASVASAIEKALDARACQLILVLGPHDEPKGTIPREVLLWKALMSPGMSPGL